VHCPTVSVAFALAFGQFNDRLHGGAKREAAVLRTSL